MTQKIRFLNVQFHIINLRPSILSPVSLAERLKVHYTTAARYLNELRDAGLLTDLRYGKYHLYINRKLLEIIGDGK